MSEIKAADVQKLRKITGAGMMDCKKALSEANGDFDKAIEIIRERGQAIANKRADREAGEGVVLANINADATLGAMIVLNCETDFVAKNEDFVNLAGQILDLALQHNPSSLDELKKLVMSEKSVEDIVIEQTGVIGEKLELSYFDKVEAAQVVAYIHPGNKLATLVGLNQKAEDQAGKDVAMQVAAMNPVAIDKDNVPADVVEKERQIGREQARLEGKPENMLDKIAEGKLNKFYKESTLLNQEFIKESKKTVRQYLQEIDKSLNVSAFKRFSLKD